MAATLPKRYRIITEALRRLRLISVANGFLTDVGANVFWGFVPVLGQDDVKQAIALLIGEDELAGGFQGGKVSLRLPLNIAALVSPEFRDRDEPGKQVELMLADIKRAMELDDNTFGGLLRGGNNVTGLSRGTTEVFERRTGTDPIGVVITYAAPYVESWGSPEA